MKGQGRHAEEPGRSGAVVPDKTPIPVTPTPPGAVEVPQTPSEMGPRRLGRVRGLLDRLYAWREGVRSRPRHHRAYKITVGLVGAAIVVAGIAFLPLPGPGWVIIFIGLAVLASEFVWAQRLEHFTRRTVRGWNEWLTAQRLPIRILLWAIMALFVAAVLYGLFVVTGVPSWVPDRLVPPLPGLGN